MTAATLTLTEFLLARIAEDEERFRKWALGGEISQTFRDRLLAECEAKRRIVDVWIAQWSLPEDGYPPRPLGGQGAEVYYEVLTHLAAVYADHPDYRDEWRN